MEKEKTERNSLNKIFIIAMVLVIVLLILNNFMLNERRIKVAEAKEIFKEQSRPAELQLIKITRSNCEDCFDIEKAIIELKNQNINITSEETFSINSQQGKEIISKYDIKKLPTMIISGEVNKSEQLVNYFNQKGEISENNFVFTALNPPYLDLSSNQIKGQVQIKNIIDSSCNKCVSLSSVSSLLKEQGVFIKNEKSVEYNSDEGRDLINKFEIKEVPAVLISDDIDYYSQVKTALTQSGAVKKSGFYVIHSTVPPYRYLSQNRIIGMIEVIYLTKNDCTECYSVSVNKNILLRFGIVINNEKTYDINSPEGKQFIQKYNIKKVPIIILSPDANYYLSLKQAWRSVGSTESDGWFVMRNPEAIGTYWDIELNKIVEANN